MTQLIILAAGLGSRLYPLTKDRPKCLVPLHSTALVEWQIRAAREEGIDEITIVSGYRDDMLNFKGVKKIINQHYETTNMVKSLLCAEDCFGEHFIVSYGDIVYKPSVLESLINSNKDVSVSIDLEWSGYWKQRFADPFSDAESLRMNDDGMVLSIGQKVSDLSEIQGQYIGLTGFHRDGVKLLKELSKKERLANSKGSSYLCEEKTLNNMYMTDLLQGIIDKGCSVYANPIRGSWLEIDSLSDLELAHKLSVVDNNKLFIKR